MKHCCTRCGSQDLITFDRKTMSWKQWRPPPEAEDAPPAKKGASPKPEPKLKEANPNGTLPDWQGLRCPHCQKPPFIYSTFEPAGFIPQRQDNTSSLQMTRT